MIKLVKEVFLYLGVFCFIAVFSSCERDNTFEQSITFDYDCADLEVFFGDACTTLSGEEGIMSEDCECAAQYDCPSFEANIGDTCMTAFDNPGLYDNNCECTPIETFDCPHIEANFGDPCTRPNGSSGFINHEGCECQ